jgi:carboxylesterase
VRELLETPSVHPLAEPCSVPARPELTNGRSIGCVLSHGFTSTPAALRPLADALAARGYAVEVPRLPGHGTTWQDLNRTSWSDWYGELTRAFDKLDRDCEYVLVGGHSFGGGMALQLAAERADRVAGVILVNPSVMNTRKDATAVAVLKYFLRSVPGMANDIKKPGAADMLYPRIPLRAAASLMAGRARVRSFLPRVTAPIISFRSIEDHMVDPASARAITKLVSSTDFTERRLDNSYHFATLDNDAPQICTETAAFIARVTSPTP